MHAHSGIRCWDPTGSDALQSGTLQLDHRDHSSFTTRCDPTHTGLTGVTVWIFAVLSYTRVSPHLAQISARCL